MRLETLLNYMLALMFIQKAIPRMKNLYKFQLIYGLIGNVSCQSWLDFNEKLVHELREGVKKQQCIFNGQADSKG